MAEPILVLDRVSLRYGALTVFSELSLTLAPGERVAVFGPSGCGKTSLLRLCAGLALPERGSVTCRARRLAVQFQEPRLLPWRTAAENINILLSDRRATLPEAIRRLSAFGLDAADACKYPRELSGGMQQRVSLARAMVPGGDLLLLDEPFKALDAELRARVTDTISRAAGDAAVLLVTHDPADAEAMGCRRTDFFSLCSG